MLGPTHFALGIATALIATHPTTIPGVIAAATGGGLGGWIVDLDMRNRKMTRARVYDGIIDILFIGAFVTIDFLIGNGMCQYVQSNWNIQVWGALMALIILILIGLNSGHHKFTHSFIALALFSTSVYFFCRPAAFSFFIGYVFHMIADLFNKRGEQLFWPVKWFPCFHLCDSNGTANKLLFRISVIIDFALGGTLFALALVNKGGESAFITKLQTVCLFGLNTLQIYLFFINLVTFLGFERSYQAFQSGEDTDKDKNEFYTWFLDLLAFVGGGLGMLVCFLIHRESPRGYNGNWWSFLYASLLFWFTIYCYVVNPFRWKIGTVKWISTEHISLLIYLIGINMITGLFFYTFRKKHLDESSMLHTFLIILGMLGGTIGGMITVIGIKRTTTYNYAVIGFPVMLVGQIVFVVYMMMVSIF